MGSWGSLTAIATGQHLSHPLRPLPPATDFDQPADQIADHLVQEAVALKAEMKAAAHRMDVDGAHGADVICRGSAGGCVSTKVMAADEMGHGLAHGVQIERGAALPRNLAGG